MARLISEAFAPELITRPMPTTEKLLGNFGYRIKCLSVEAVWKVLEGDA